MCVMYVFIVHIITYNTHTRDLPDILMCLDSGGQRLQDIRLQAQLHVRQITYNQVATNKCILAAIYSYIHNIFTFQIKGIHQYTHKPCNYIASYLIPARA